jgi:hypothetical protein
MNTNKNVNWTSTDETEIADDDMVDGINFQDVEKLAGETFQMRDSLPGLA